MWNRIRTKIFLPTLIMLILVPISTCLVFFSVAKTYMRTETADHVETLVHYIQTEASAINPLSPELRKEESSALLRTIRDFMRNQQPEASLFVFNHKMEEIYPSKEQGSADASVHCRNWLIDEVPSTETLYYKEWEQNHYAVMYWQTYNESGNGNRYYVAFKQIPDVSLLISTTTKYILGILGVLFLISVVLVWKISESLFRSIEELNKEKAQIFQNISHDLKTPLSSIIGYASGLSAGIVNDPPKAYRIILDESHRMNRMLDGILTLSKLENHAWNSTPVPIPLEDFLLEQIDVLQGTAGEKQLYFDDSAHSGDTIIIEADGELLTRIVQNVLSNAIRYASHTVSLSLRKTETHAIVTISDDGPGIAPDVMKHLFTRYYSGTNGHHGLGLTIVKTGMEYLGGSVRAHNKTGTKTGAVFQLMFPL